MKTSALRVPNPRLPVARDEDWCQPELFESDPRPETVCFRRQTMAIMRHFFEISSQLGRLPSLLGREFFHAKVSHHAIPSFEDQVVFVRDVELCLERLSEEHAEMITLIGLFDFSRDEIAAMLHYSRTWVSMRSAKSFSRSGSCAKTAPTVASARSATSPFRLTWSRCGRKRRVLRQRSRRKRRFSPTRRPSRSLVEVLAMAPGAASFCNPLSRPCNSFALTTLPASPIIRRLYGQSRHNKDFLLTHFFRKDAFHAISTL